MADDEGPVYIGERPAFTAFLRTVPGRLRERVKAHLKYLAHHPDSAWARAGEFPDLAHRDS